MRILFAVLSPLTPELGASQMALNLSAALRGLGVDAVVWTPLPAPAGMRWWRRIGWMRERIADYVRQDGSFDVVDAPAVAITASLARQCPVIARSVQPDLIYLWTEAFHARGARIESVVRRIAGALVSVYLAALVVCGWSRACRILCLGSAELAWMQRWFPWWRGKLHSYMNALSDDERQHLAEVRARRQPASAQATRFLWLGRWTAHKGVDVLLDFVRGRLTRCPGDRFTIAGCGPEAQRQIPAPLLQDARIRLVPSYGRDQLSDLLASHDIGLFTSRAEGWGLTLQEMLESGMPVYATEAGGVPDLMSYFGGQLRRFPPPVAASGPTKTSSTDWPRYYDRFSWRTIAQGYAAMASEVESTRGSRR